MTPEIESLKKEARESFLGDCPIPKCSACRVDGILIDELLAKAFLAGKKEKSMTDIALAFDAGEKSGKNKAVVFIEKNIVSFDKQSIESPFLEIKVDDIAKLLEEARTS